mgnify:CR=1 FL=1
MRNYELTFIIDPVLSGDEIKATANKYIDQVKAAGSEIVYINEWGLRQLAYPINNRSTGIYYTIEFAHETGALVDEVELALRRDEKVMRFLTVKLDKFGVKYNEDNRAGKIGAYKRQKAIERAARQEEEKKNRNNRKGGHRGRRR